MPSTASPSHAAASLEDYFDDFRRQVIGYDQRISTPYGQPPLLYADWTASGRQYAPIEDWLCQRVAPYVANTHTETSTTGCVMTRAYHHARHLIKQHCGAYESDVLICTGSGMTGAVSKLQRILGLKVHEDHYERVCPAPAQRPVVFVTHMEHHSNQTSWLETLAEVVVIPPAADGLVDLAAFEALLQQYAERPVKIAAVTSCSNVTGIITPYYEMAERIHRVGGWCFVDFACSAPYIDINMRPEHPLQQLDAIYFSPHKFLGGPGSCGILIFDPRLYRNRIPDQPGGGTVDWTDPWGGHKYSDHIETREDGGTPAFLQALRVARSIQLKEAMTTAAIQQREHEILARMWPRLDAIPNLRLLASQHRDRLGVISFYIEGLHYNLGVRLLNDRFGVQVRGGCSCAGTYGHYLLNVDQHHSHAITSRISAGDLSDKPGWIRMSIHPVMTNAEVDNLLTAIEAVAAHHETWGTAYRYDRPANEFVHRSEVDHDAEVVAAWFDHQDWCG